MVNAGKRLRREEIEFFLRLHGLWEGVVSLPPPPDPPYDIESIEPTDVPPVWVWAGEQSAFSKLAKRIRRNHLFWRVSAQCISHELKRSEH